MLSRVMCIVFLAGCYQSHRPLGDGDASRPEDAGGPDTTVVLVDGGVDATVSAPCDEVAALTPVAITRAPPNDFTLGAVDRSPFGGPERPVVVAFTSSNDAREMDVQRWIHPVDPVSGERLREERIVAFGPPRGRSYSGLARLYYSDEEREGITFSYGRNEGCVLRPVDSVGQPTGPEVRIADDACLSARVGPDGNFVLFFRTRDDSDLAYFAWLDGGDRIVRTTEPSNVLGGSRDSDWIVMDGEIRMARGGSDGLEVGRWDEARNELVDVTRVRGGRDVRSPRIVQGARTVVGWLEGERGAIHFMPFGGSSATPVGIDSFPRAGWAAMWRGNELWVASAQARGEDHAAARVEFTRLRDDFEIIDQQLVGDGSFPQRIRIVPTEAGAMVVNQALRRDLEGGHAVFTTPLHCSDESIPRSCDIARIDPCAGPCDDLEGYVWTIEGCVESRCNCEGPACALAHPSLEACEAATDDCDRTLCLESEGEWIAPNEVYCDHPRCGTDVVDCDTAPEAVCHCGARAQFRPGFGCEPGCRGIETREELCRHSGGQWGGAMCCPSICGRSCGDDCASVDCLCPASMVWSELAGCVPSPLCPTLVLCP